MRKLSPRARAVIEVACWTIVLDALIDILLDEADRFAGRRAEKKLHAAEHS